MLGSLYGSMDQHPGNGNGNGNGNG